MNSCILVFGPVDQGRAVAEELERRGLGCLCHLEATAAVPFMDGCLRVVDSHQFHQGLSARIYLATIFRGDIGSFIATPIAEIQQKWTEQRVPIVLCGRGNPKDDQAKRRLRALDPDCRIGSIVLGAEAGDLSHPAIELIVRSVASESFWNHRTRLDVQPLA